MPVQRESSGGLGGLGGATLVAAATVPARAEPGASLTVQVTLDGSVVRAGLRQRLLRLGPGRSAPGGAAGHDDVWFVAAGRGELHAAPPGAHALEPDLAVLLAPGTDWSVDNPGPEDLVVVSVEVPAAPGEPAGPKAPVFVRLADRPAIPTGDREFRVLLDPAAGCQGVTQFVGWIPPGRAPVHSHSYDEVVYVLEGEGLLHAGGGVRPIGAGSCIHLPPPLPHCLENTGAAPMRVLGVFHPAGSPAAKQAARQEMSDQR